MSKTGGEGDERCRRVKNVVRWRDEMEMELLLLTPGVSTRA